MNSQILSCNVPDDCISKKLRQYSLLLVVQNLINLQLLRYEELSQLQYIVFVVSFVFHSLYFTNCLFVAGMSVFYLYSVNLPPIIVSFILIFLLEFNGYKK